MLYVFVFACSAVQELSKMIPKTEASLHKDRAELDTVTATEAKLNEQVRLLLDNK